MPQLPPSSGSRRRCALARQVGATRRVLVSTQRVAHAPRVLFDAPPRRISFPQRSRRGCHEPHARARVLPISPASWRNSIPTIGCKKKFTTMAPSAPSSEKRIQNLGVLCVLAVKTSPSIWTRLRFGFIRLGFITDLLIQPRQQAVAGLYRVISGIRSNGGSVSR